MNQKSSGLELMNSYSFPELSSNERVKDQYTFRKKLSDMVTFDWDIKNQIKETKEHRMRLSLPYDNLLHFLYIPSLNIWKNPFTNEVDTNLIGEKFLKNNPYSDISLIQQWTDFFKDMWTDQYNLITDISLESMKKEDNWFVSIPLTVQFETPDRRSFLLLLNKLSMTSYAENVSLINEFMFYLRENIKNEQADTIQQLISSKSIPSSLSWSDQIIGYVFFQWITNGTPNNLLTQDIINKTITKVAWCTTEDQEKCLYMFREKYRSLPYLAYSVGRSNVNSVKWLQQFLQKLPPIISLENLSFDRKTKKGKISVDEWYKWSISIKVYAMDVLSNEVDDIADKLWWLCFVDKSRMSSSQAITILTKLIDQLWKQYSINEKRARQLRQMVDYITTIQSDYDTLPNYKKVIRLFEIYRTVKEWNACDLVNVSTELPKNELNDLVIFSWDSKKDVFSGITTDTFINSSNATWSLISGEILLE
jgi:hypothetical protein